MSKFFREYVFKLVVTLAVTGTVTVVAVINKYWTWPNAVVGGVLLLCGVLYLTDRFGIGPSLKSRVRDWLDSSGFDIRTVQNSNEFHFVMTDSIGLSTDIFKANSDAPINIISGKHLPTPQRLATFKALTKPQQDAFWKNIRLELLRYGISFSALTLEGEGVSFSDGVIAVPTLTGVEFLKRVLFVRTGARLYQELLAALDDYGQSSATETAPTQLVV